MDMKIKHKRIDEDRFLEMRKEVLAQWPTGKEVDLDEAVEYQKKLPESKSFLKITEKLHKEGRTVVYPRAGTALVEDMISLCRRLVASGVRYVPVTTDSYTRLLQFKRVEDALEETKRTGRTVLNGYPLINHGVKKTRKVIESVDEGAFDPRVSYKAQPLGSEIAFASGMTGMATGPFISWGAYEKNATLEETIAVSQYVQRLIGYYADRGVIITTDLHGWIVTGVQPMSVNLATMMAEAMMAAEQGVKSIIPLVHFMGNMAQDLAWLRVTPRLMREYLDRFGYKDVIIPGTFAAQTPLFPMPQGMGGAFAFPDYTAVVAALGKAESVFLRTIDEGAGVPTEDAHALTYESANWFFDVIRGQRIEFEIKETAEEERITELEIRAILDKLLEMGDGDIVVGSIKGVAAGVIDSSFSPNRQVHDRVIGVKDCKGAIRYVDFGNLPLPEEVKEFHREKVAERAKAEGREMNYEVTVQDFWAFSKGNLLGKGSPGSLPHEVQRPSAPAKQPTVITGTVGSDAHVIGTKVLTRALREAGFNAVELGCLTKPEEFIESAIETNADAILISSLYGMAELDLRDFKEKCIESGLENVLLYIGGILAVGRHDFKEDEKRFKAMGFDRVYPSETNLKAALEDLWADLKAKGRA
jgi:methylaspartate mutase epsilon subunit